MSTTQAMSSQNTYIATGDGASPELFTAELAEVKNIGGPNETSEDLDATHLRSPGGYREFIPSFKDGGELPLTLNMLPSDSTQQALRTEFASTPPPTKNRRIFYPDGTTATFAAYVKGIGSAAQVGNILEMNLTLRIVGPVTWDPAE